MLGANSGGKSGAGMGMVKFSKGVELRAQIDQETARALLIINGGGAVSLLALLPSLLANQGYRILVLAIHGGLLLFMLGLVAAVIHNIIRRECSRIHELYNWAPPADKKRICKISRLFRNSSIACFGFAGSIVALAGLWTLTRSAALQVHLPLNLNLP
jgi:hypothetical protein